MRRAARETSRGRVGRRRSTIRVTKPAKNGTPRYTSTLRNTSPALTGTDVAGRPSIGGNTAAKNHA